MDWTHGISLFKKKNTNSLQHQHALSQGATNRYLVISRTLYEKSRGVKWRRRRMRAAGRKKRRKRIRELLCKHKKKKQRLLKTRCPNQRHSNHWPSVALVATERQRLEWGALPREKFCLWHSTLQDTLDNFTGTHDAIFRDDRENFQVQQFLLLYF